MKINLKRLEERILTLSTYTDSQGEGVTRFSYSQKDKEARKYLIDILEAMNLKVTTDPIGNILGLYEGEERTLTPVWIGSHIDSVKNGGKYDGIVGAMGALEVVSVFWENGYIPQRSIVVVFFAEEEGSNFDNTMVGSKAITGKLTKEDLKNQKNENGISCYQMVKDFGLPIDDLDKSIIKKGDIYAMVELHIEQGAVLEEEGKRLGVVEAIAGMTTLEVEIEGDSNHAGGTPMHLRKDPMVGAAAAILEINKIAREKVNEATVATVGTINCLPNKANIIPKIVTFRVDVRDVESEGISRAVNLIEEEIQSIAKELQLKAECKVIGSSKPYTISHKIKKVIEEKIQETGEPYKKINSGAVHDCAMLSDITDIGMIFVPSINGYSHQDLEFTPIEDIGLGAQVLLETVLELGN